METEYAKNRWKAVKSTKREIYGSKYMYQKEQKEFK